MRKAPAVPRLHTHRGPVVVRPIRTWGTPRPLQRNTQLARIQQRKREIKQQQTATIYDTPFFVDGITPVTIHNPLETSGEVPALYGSKEEEEHLIQNMTSSAETSAPVLLEAAKTSNQPPETHTATPKTSAAFPKPAPIPRRAIAAARAERTKAPTPAPTQTATDRADTAKPLARTNCLPWIIGAAAVAAFFMLKK